MQIISNWLAGTRNFTVGALLYKSFGTNPQLKKLLTLGETPFALKLLTEELQKIADKGLEPPPVQPATPETAVMEDSDDEVLQALKNEWQGPYQRMNLLRHQLDKFGNSNSNEAIAYRQELVFDIKKLESECEAIWAKRDHYLEHGKLPFTQEKKIEIPTDPVKLATLIQNIKKNIRRNRNRMELHPTEPKYAQLYQDYKIKHKQVTGEEYNEKD